MIDKIEKLTNGNILFFDSSKPLQGFTAQTIAEPDRKNPEKFVNVYSEIFVNYNAQINTNTLIEYKTPAGSTFETLNTSDLINKLYSDFFTSPAASISGTIQNEPITSYINEVASGNILDTRLIDKFGYNRDIDTGTEEIIASFGGAFNPLTDVIKTAQTCTITYNPGTDGAGQTGATQLIISYINESFEEQSTFHILGGTGSDITAFNCYGINRVVVYANGGAGTAVNNIDLTATTLGTIQARIPAGKSTTQQALFFTDIAKKFNLDSIIISCLKLTGGGSPRVNILGYSYSRVTDTIYNILDFEIDTDVDNNLVLKPNPINFQGREVIYFSATTDKDNTKVSLRFQGIQGPA